MSEQMDFRLCDGLDDISPDECNTITITGMGGETIAGILKRAGWTKNGKRLILQPQSTQDFLRIFLCENGYHIVLETVVCEGERWYPILLVQGGQMPRLAPGETMAGRAEDWADQPERINYLRWLLNRTERQLAGVSRSTRDQDKGRQSELREAALFLSAQIDRLSK